MTGINAMPLPVANRIISVRCCNLRFLAKAPYTLMQRAMHIHLTVSEFVPTMMDDLVPLR